MLFQVAQVKLQLAFVISLKFVDLEINGEEAAQAAVLEKQVDEVVAVVDGK